MAAPRTPEEFADEALRRMCVPGRGIIHDIITETIRAAIEADRREREGGRS